MSVLSGAWRRLCARCGRIHAQADQQRRSRLLSWLILIMLVAFGTVDLVEAHTQTDYQVPWIGYALMVSSYLLNWRGLFCLASWLQMSMFPLVIFSSVLHHDPGFTIPDLSYLLLGIMLASLLRDFLETILFAAFNLLSMLALPLLAPEVVPSWGSMLTPLATTGIGTTLVLGILHYRDLQEQDHQAEQFRAEAERARHKERLLQAEKLEAIGLLAGGIAHDFNNLLGGIMGFAELLSKALKDSPDLQRYADKILSAAQCSATRTGQLLAFARKGDLQHAPVDLNRLIAETIDLLRHGMDGRITLCTHLAPDPVRTIGDSSQLQTALLNVAINARDAMPAGGQLTLASSITTIPFGWKTSWTSQDPTPGRYACIEVRDTGIGMGEETLRHAFEPFYTTKADGNGTGLGLSAVYGTVNAHGGFIDLTSEVGQGTTFRLFLPCADTETETPPPPPLSPA